MKYSLKNYVLLGIAIHHRFLFLLLERKNKLSRTYLPPTFELRKQYEVKLERILMELRRLFFLTVQIYLNFLDEISVMNFENIKIVKFKIV